MTRQRVEFIIQMDLAEGQDVDGWSDSVLQAVEAVAPRQEGRVVGGVGVQRLCTGGKHDRADQKQATFTYCGNCGWIDEVSGP